MSSGQRGGKNRGKGKGRGKGRGRGGQQQQQQRQREDSDVPGGLQRESREEQASVSGEASSTSTSPQAEMKQQEPKSQRRGKQHEQSPSSSQQPQQQPQKSQQQQQQRPSKSQQHPKSQQQPSKPQQQPQQPSKPQQQPQQPSKPQQQPQQPSKLQQQPQQPSKPQQQPQQASKSQQQPQQPTKPQQQPQQPSKPQQQPQQPSKPQQQPQQPSKPQQQPQQPSKPQQQPQQPSKPQQQPQQPSKPQQQPQKSQKPPSSQKGSIKLPRRPDQGGKVGRPITLRANFLPVKIPENDVHHYDTEIEMEGKPAGEGYTKKEAPQIINGMVKQYEKKNPNGPKLVFDRNGKNVYCRTLIPDVGRTFEHYKVKFTTDNGKEREYNVRIKWRGQVSLYELNQALEGKYTEIPQSTLQAIEVVINHLPSMTSIRIGSSFFMDATVREKDIGYGLQLWNGTFVSIRPTQWKMMLNIDTSSTAFYKEQSVLAFLCDVFELRNVPNKLSPDQIRRFAKEIKAIKIETTHIKRRQKGSGVSKLPARQESFDCEGVKKTVYDYFREKYNITLRYPDLPCIKLGQKGTCVPMELCNVMRGQRKQGRLNPKQTQMMIRHTALPAPDRFQAIQDLVKQAKFNQDPNCKDFGIQVGTEMVKIQGRVLEPPVISYGPKDKPSAQKPRNGVWRIDQRPMYQPAKNINVWGIISFEGKRFFDDRMMETLIKKLVKAGDEVGVKINPSPCYWETGSQREAMGGIFAQYKEEFPDIQLLIVILPGRDGDACYSEVKRYGDVEYGIITQCIKASNAKRAVERFTEMEAVVNIFLKINAKLGGTGSVLDKSVRSPILSRPVIIFGADVTHPSPQDTTTPSIAAVVASMDSHPNLYAAEVRVQKHRQEMISDLRGMVIQLMKKFKGRTGVKPEHILFYRDGVSEGQFQDVLLNELTAIQQACRELQSDYQPAITFLVVQKRHHARFVPENPKDQQKKSRNIPAGTVVDKQVCHPFEFNWYLCSHEGIQGTSKPALYHVLYDDSNFKSDELQILTNQLCYTYVRCARAVSIPAPAYYAHHVAFRARHHLSDIDKDSSDGSVMSGSQGEANVEDMVRAVTIHPSMVSTMYFA